MPSKRRRKATPLGQGNPHVDTLMQVPALALLMHAIDILPQSGFCDLLHVCYGPVLAPRILLEVVRRGARSPHQCQTPLQVPPRKQRFACLFCTCTYASSDGALKHVKKRHRERLHELERGDTSRFCTRFREN